MALQTIVKVGNITNLSDARYCAGMGVDMIGFVMDRFSNDYLSPDKAKEIQSWIAGAQFVGETDSADYDEIMTMLQDYEVDILQISDPALLPRIANAGKPILLKTDAESAYLDEHLQLYTPYVNYFLIDGQELSDFFLHQLKQHAAETPVILGFGINARNVQQLLADMPLKGIALKGTHEIRPGYKDYDELSDILEVLEVD